MENADVDAVADLWLEVSIEKHGFINKSFWESQMRPMKEEYLKAADTLVASADGKIVGFISLLGGYIAALFVAGDWHGRGIGSMLIAKHGNKALTVGVYKKNVDAFKFYSKKGFNVTRTELQQETGETVVMMERLVPSELPGTQDLYV